MKILLLIFALVSIPGAQIFAQTGWNKEVQGDRQSEGLGKTTIIRNLSGIGAVINKVNEECIIFEVLKNSGAAAAGLEKLDVIKSIDSKNISALELPEIAALLRGEPGTEVVLSIQRGEESEARDFTVVRQPLKIE